MNAQRWLTVVSIILLTGCAAPMPAVLNCASPPALPASVIEQASRQQQTYSDRVKPLLQSLEMQIETGRR